MKNRVKGFTLIEIIVAIGLIGIISAGFLGVISNNYQFLFDTKKITESAFLAQQDMELGIENAKELIASPSNGGLTMHAVSLFEGVSVNYYELANTFDGRTYYTYVSDQRLPSIAKLNVSGVAANKRYDTLSTKYIYPLSNANLRAEFVNDPATIDDLMVNVYSWYVSKPGYNIPVPKGNNSTFFYMTDLPESEVIGRYPVFPSDFYLISTETTADLIDLSPYAGRQVVLTVTPAAKSGKIGNPGISLPVHINGLKQTTGLALHLDASYIDPFNSTEVLAPTNRAVLRWYDLASNIGVANPTQYATSTSSTRRPQVVDTDNANSFVARYLNFDANKDMYIDSQGTSGQTVTYFAVVKGKDIGRDEKIFVNGSFTANVSEIPEDMLQIDGWYLVKGSYTSNSNAFTIGNDNIDLIELYIYTGTVDDVAVTEYIKSKYIPLDSDATILSLYDQTDEVFVGDPYVLPSAVTADMSSGLDRLVFVTWSGTVTTDTPKVVVLTGTSVLDPTKTMTLTVTVKPKILATDVLLTPGILNLQVGDSQQIIGEIVPNNANDQTIVWETSNPSVATVTDGNVTALSVGNATITATSGDGAASNTCSVTVSAVPVAIDTMPTGLVLQLDAGIGINLNDAYVSSWNDQAGTDNTFVQGLYDYMPGYNTTAINSLPGVTFNIENDEHMIYASNNLESVRMFTKNKTNFSLFVVGKADVVSGDNSTFFSQTAGNATAFALERQSNGKFSVKVKDNRVISVNGLNGLNLHAVEYDGSTLNYRLNKSLVGTSNTTDYKNSNGSNFYIGRQYSSGYLSGEIKEVLMFNRDLTAAEMTYVENYLYDKWFRTRIKSWEFSASSDVSGLTRHDFSTLNWTSPGYINGVISGIDPNFVLPTMASSEGVNLNNGKTIKIRLKNQTSSAFAQLYYTTYNSGDGGFDEVKHINFPILPNSDFIEYTIDMTGIPKWSGLLKQLRIDPATYAGGFSGPYGSMQIDYIRIIQ